MGILTSENMADRAEKSLAVIASMVIFGYTMMRRSQMESLTETVVVRFTPCYDGERKYE
jgi:hypothetical protein